MANLFAFYIGYNNYSDISHGQNYREIASNIPRTKPSYSIGLAEDTSSKFQPLATSAS
jgi:hypothetical protein